MCFYAWYTALSSIECVDVLSGDLDDITLYYVFFSPPLSGGLVTTATEVEERQSMLCCVFFSSHYCSAAWLAAFGDMRWVPLVAMSLRWTAL